MELIGMDFMTYSSNATIETYLDEKHKIVYTLLTHLF